MKKFIVFSLICFLWGIMLIACQRDRGVQAGNESDTYQPRPAPPKGEVDVRHNTLKREMKGELARVDMPGKTIVIRLENGMIQTFKFDENTSVAGLESLPPAKTTKPGKVTNINMRNLVGKEGSEVTIRWNDDNGDKMATKVEVTQISTAQTTRRSRR